METFVTRRMKIETHPQRANIERDIIRGLSLRQIANKYGGITHATVKNYRDANMTLLLRHAQVESADGIVARINEYMDNIEALRDSIIDILRDPNDPSKISYYPQAQEIKIKYKDKGQWRVDKLQDLLERAQEKNPQASIKGTYVEVTDPRVMLVKVADTLNRNLELLCKVNGTITTNAKLDVSISQERDVSEIVEIAKNTLSPWPEALDVFVKALISAAEKGDRQLNGQ